MVFRPETASLILFSELVSSNSGILMIFFVILAFFLIILSIHLGLRITKMEKRLRRFMKGRDGFSLEQSFANEFERLDDLREKADQLSADIIELRHLEKLDFSKYGVVKYDAFSDVGGKLSFVLALLNDNDTGFVLNAIHSKENCYLYLKEIMKGESFIPLSSEEIEALTMAKQDDEIHNIEKIMSTNEADKEDNYND